MYYESDYGRFQTMLIELAGVLTIRFVYTAAQCILETDEILSGKLVGRLTVETNTRTPGSFLIHLLNVASPEGVFPSSLS